MNEMMQKLHRMTCVMIDMVEKENKKEEYAGIITLLYFMKVCFSGEFWIVQGVITILPLMQTWKKIGEQYMRGMDEII